MTATSEDFVPVSSTVLLSLAKYTLDSMVLLLHDIIYFICM